jgi:hypothetical protein
LAKELIDAVRRLPSAIMQKTQSNKSGYRPIELEHTLRKKIYEPALLWFVVVLQVKIFSV